MGDSTKGVNYVDSPAGTKVNSDESLLAAQLCETLIKDSGLEPFNKNKNEGCWRCLLFRESKVTNQALVSLVLSEGYDLTVDLKSKITQTFQRKFGDKEVVSISLIYTAEMSGAYKETDRVE